MLALFREQPRAFYMIFMLEIWERFGFYTVQGILTLYFIRFMGFSDTQAYYTFGAFSALVYGLVAIGGYLGDSVLGTKRVIILGLVVLALGYLSLALVNEQQVFYALGLVCVGNGLFKANPSSLLSKCYQEHDARLHGGFTLYYMAINLGSIVALFIGPYLAATYGYPYAYFVSFIGIALGIANYFFQRNHIKNINNAADKKNICLYNWLVVIAGIFLATITASYFLQHVELTEKLLWLITTLIVVIYLYLTSQEEKHAALKMFVALVLMIEAVIFFTLYQQMPTSLNLFAVNNVRPYLLGVNINPQSFQSLNPIWIIIISPLLATAYKKLNSANISFPIPHKFALGMSCCGISFSLLFFSRFFADTNGVVSPMWLVASYLFQSTGELLVSALGVAMIAELVPRKMVGFIMGMWFLTSSVAGFFGAYVASFTAISPQVNPGLDSLDIYTKVFGYIGIITLIVAGALWLTSPLLYKLIRQK